MHVRHKHFSFSRNRHPRIEPLEARLALSADFGGLGDDFGPTPHEFWEDFGPRPTFAQWSHESFAGSLERGDDVIVAEMFDRTLSQYSEANRRPIAALWQPSTGTLYVLFAPTANPFDETPVATPNGGGPLRSQLSPPPTNDLPINDVVLVRGPGDANVPLSLAALELLGSDEQLTSHVIASATAHQPTALNMAAAPIADATAQLIAAATPGFEKAAVERGVDEPLSARDAAYANSADTQWLEITREETAQVQKLLDANRLPQANRSKEGVVEMSSAELKPEDYMAADWVNDIVLLAAANSADDAELFLALSGESASAQTATKVGLSLGASPPQAEAVAAATETLAPSRTLRWCGAVLAPVLFAAAMRDRVKRKAASGVER